MIEELRNIYGRVSVHATADAEHAAVLDLLLLVAFADHRLRPDELDEINTLVDDHGWESSTFSLSQYFGEGVAKVRSAMDAEGDGDGVERLLTDIDNRINNTVLRREISAMARDVADADHNRSVQESGLLDKIRRRFAVSP
jgi:hypothetical protein